MEAIEERTIAEPRIIRDLECTAVLALMTIRDIARQCGTRVHRVRYVIDELNIEPRQRAGNIRLWSRDQVPEIQAGLERTADGRKSLIPSPKMAGFQLSR